jgi:hypothetical protein
LRRVLHGGKYASAISNGGLGLWRPVVMVALALGCVCVPPSSYSRRWCSPPSVRHPVRGAVRRSGIGKLAVHRRGC